MKASNMVCSLVLLVCSTVLADTHYVDISNATPSHPYTNWVTAATNIQDAVDAAESGDTVLVNDGIYDSGTRVRPGYSLMYRVVFTNDITLQSVNGPEHTIIVGKGPIGSTAVGCVYMTAGHLAGFTVTNGHNKGVSINHTPYSTVSNCIFVGNKTVGYGGGIRAAGYLKIDKCTFADNEAEDGGGIENVGVMYVNNCTFIGNSATGIGGGINNFFAIMTLNNCIFVGNKARLYGGGVCNDFGGELTANNCMFLDNQAEYGGGIDSDDGSLTLYNCTFAYNVSEGAGGVYAGDNDVYYNCIFWGNFATNLHHDIYGQAECRYSCSAQLTNGVNGNITNAPLFIGAGNYRLAPSSPCINAGSNGYVTVATDLDGKPRIIDGTVDMGAYEAFYITNSHPSTSGFALEWMTPATGWNSVVQYSTNLVSMSFTNLSGSMAYPVNSYTDAVHGAESQCFYHVEMVP